MQWSGFRPAEREVNLVRISHGFVLKLRTSNKAASLFACGLGLRREYDAADAQRRQRPRGLKDAGRLVQHESLEMLGLLAKPPPSFASNELAKTDKISAHGPSDIRLRHGLVCRHA